MPVVFALSCLFPLVARAEVIWLEDFSTYAHMSGITGAGVVHAGDYPGAVTRWTLDASGCVLSDSDDYVAAVTTSGGRLEAVDIDGEAVWRSEEVDISGYKDVSLSVETAETGLSDAAHKNVRLFYQLDGGAETAFGTNPVLVGNWTAATALQAGLNGTTVRVVARLSNDNTGDKVIINSVLMTGRPFKPEPSGYATGFEAASVTHRTLVLAWTDAVGDTPPDGYLLLGSAQGAEISPIPVDGSVAINDTDWSDGAYAVNIACGVQTVEVRGLVAGHAYIFRLFPWTNAGTDRDYKTDGSVPLLPVTAGVAPFEDFENVQKLGYESAPVSLGSGDWQFDNTVLQIDTTDKRHDQRAARIRNLGSITMLFDVTDVETVALDHANYGADTGGKFVVERSLDGGSTWRQIGNEVTCGTTLQTAEFTVHSLQAVRLRLRKTAPAEDQKRINIDNIRLMPFKHEGSVFRFR